MFRMWVKMISDNHLLRDTVICNNMSDMTRTKKVLTALEEACQEFDICTPIWLKPNISEFKRVAKTRFRADNFIEGIEFDYLEIHVIEEDEIYP